MKTYKYHKTVRAAQIISVETFVNGSAIIRFDDFLNNRSFTSEWMQKYAPTPGSYYVIYDDGHASVFPADAFESGFTKVIVI